MPMPKWQSSVSDKRLGRNHKLDLLDIMLMLYYRSDGVLLKNQEKSNIFSQSR